MTMPGSATQDLKEILVALLAVAVLTGAWYPLASGMLELARQQQPPLAETPLREYRAHYFTIWVPDWPVIRWNVVNEQGEAALGLAEGDSIFGLTGFRYHPANADDYEVARAQYGIGQAEDAPRVPVRVAGNDTEILQFAGDDYSLPSADTLIWCGEIGILTLVSTATTGEPAERLALHQRIIDSFRCHPPEWIRPLQRIRAVLPHHAGYQEHSISPLRWLGERRELIISDPVLGHFEHQRHGLPRDIFRVWLQDIYQIRLTSLQPGPALPAERQIWSGHGTGPEGEPVYLSATIFSCTNPDMHFYGLLIGLDELQDDDIELLASAGCPG